MTVNANRLRFKLMKGLAPGIDDPRRKFMSSLQQQLTGGLGVGASVKINKPKTKRPGVRTGRPSRPGSQ